MARRNRSVLVVAACAVALVACNLLAGLTEDYALAPDGSAATMGGDGGGDESAVGPDGARPDSPAGDAGMDAADGRVPQVPFCDRVNDAGDASVVFCSDFEMGGSSADPNPFGWSDIMRFNGADASFTIDPQGGYEGAGLHVITDKPVSGTSSAGWLEHFITAGDPNVAAHYEAEMQVKAEASPITYTALGILTFDDGAAAVREHGIATNNSNMFLKDLNPTTFLSVNNVLPPAWHHVVIQLDRPSPGAQYNRKLTIDTMTATVTPPMSLTSTGAVKLRIGTFNTGTSTGVLKARFDNVVVRQW